MWAADLSPGWAHLPPYDCGCRHFAGTHGFATDPCGLQTYHLARGGQSSSSPISLPRGRSRRSHTILLPVTLLAFSSHRQALPSPIEPNKSIAASPFAPSTWLLLEPLTKSTVGAPSSTASSSASGPPSTAASCHPPTKLTTP
jgi:hypothetical protein